MVHLHSVRLRGFKTFARPTELTFQPGVTVIIGPNGSGKSNIADAVLWVLGEQSPGNLRGSSMQDVIFSGPEGRKSSATAEVSLVFDNGSGSLPLEASQLEITRRLTRDSGSEYRLNGSGCRLLDVQDLVGGLGLGREMHSVISQGKVEALLNSTPAARRAMVEEAAGLGRFKKRRERAQAKLDRTGQNLLRVGDIEQGVKTALRPLKQQVLAAERFAEATEEWALAKGRAVLHALVTVRGSCSEAGAEVEQMQSRLAEITAGLAELRSQRTEEDEHFTAVLEEREKLGVMYHRARAEAEYVEGRAVSLRQRLARMEGELERARRRRELARSEAASLAERLEEVMAETGDEARLARVEGWAETLRAAIEEAAPAYRAAGTKEDDLKDSVFELEAARSRAVQDREFLRREREERGRVGKEVAALAEEAAARLQQLQVAAAGLQSEVAKAEEAVCLAEAELRETTTGRESARAEAEEAARAEAALSEVLAGIEARQAVLRDILARREGTSAGARELMASSETCRPLTDLLTVEPGYERALAAALGPLIQAVVVPDTCDLALTLETTGVLEVIRETGGPATAGPGTKPPAGTRDLWEVVSGPRTVIAILRRLIPPTAVSVQSDRLQGGGPAGSEGDWRLVSRTGELLWDGLHAARRQEVGAETLLKARSELEAAAKEWEAALRRRDRARDTVNQAAAAMAEAEERLRLQEERLHQAERGLAAQRSETDLHGRRIEEARAQCAELAGRKEREDRLAEQMLVDLRTADEAIAAKEAGLDEARASLRVLEAELEAMRDAMGRLEDKKRQAALVEVRLRERCRAHENERARARSQQDSASGETERCDRRVDFLERYVPVVAELLSVAQQLAARCETASVSLESQVEASRARTEGTARVMRDRGGAEADLEQEYDGLATRLTQVRVDQARLEDRRVLLEDELAELRRRHLSPRGLTSTDVAGENADALATAVERAERRRERIGPVNPLAEQECAQMEERARFLAEQRRDLEASLAELQEVIADLDQHIDRTFAEIFAATREHFSAVIAAVFPGARGSLTLTEARPGGRGQGGAGNGALDEGEEEERDQGGGIGLEVKFPNKSPRSLSLLSGGEKAMTAIAFLFSLFLARPCPFYILDEVEASLDDINIRRFLALVRKYRERTQFIIITHQRQTMEVADTLYGVALESDGTSRVLSRRLTMQRGA